MSWERKNYARMFRQQVNLLQLTKVRKKTKNKKTVHLFGKRLFHTRTWFQNVNVTNKLQRIQYNTMNTILCIH